MKKKLISLFVMAVVGATQIATAQDLSAYDGSKDNPFRIETVQQFCSLASYLKSGQMNYIVLEADLDMSGVTDWKPLFNNGGDYPFFDFDGKNHVIRNLTNNMPGAYDYPGIFGVLCGNVRNLGVENADITSTGGTGIIAGYLNHSQFNGQPCYVENVWVTGKVTASGYCGGMFGNVAGESTIYNCYANVEVNGSSDLTGGIIGRVRGQVNMAQVYAAGSINRGGGIIGGGFQDATPGGTYKHIVVWNNTNQNFGPVRDNADNLVRVFYYDGTNFARLQQEVVAWGNPWACDMGDNEYPTFAAPAGLQIVDGYYLVSDADQLNQVNEKLLGGEANINVRLTADIDLSKSATPNLMIGSENAPFTGIFDGQGHAVTYAYTDVPGHCGFFKYLKDATVRDLYVKGTAVVNGIHYGALFSHGIGNLLIENVVTDVDITGTSNTGVQGDGGMSGYLEGKATFNNCATLGTMGNANTSMYCGFVAYATDAASSTLNNCYTACSLTEGTGTGYCFTFCRGSYVANNCYYLNAIGEVQGIQTTEEQIKSGALCYLLNGDQSKIQWTQTLKTDLVPQPGTKSQQVYATGALLCDGTEIPNSPLVYTNTEGTPEIPAHQFGDDGFCTVCGNMKQNEAGYYLVGNADQFIRFAEKVAAGKTDMNVLLTGDIDLSKSGNVWVGDVTNSYKGTFDGAGHTITYNFNSTVDKWSGLFAHITGATIRNLYVTGEAVVTGIHYGALIGVAYGDVLVENVITNVKITGQRSGVTGDGGMLGANYAKITFNNCATLGAFGNPGSSMYSSFSAWSNGSSATTLNNCFTACALTDGTGTGNCFTLTHTSGNVTINNCYYLNEVGKVQGTPYAEDQIASGALCYMLNGDQSNITWYQKIGEDHIPTPNPSRGTVYKTGETTYANVDMTIPAVIDGVVQIATGKDLRGFAEMVNSGQNHLSAVLTADIDYGTDNTMIGVSDTEAGAYRGCFDGQGHSITINMTASGNYQTLFKYLGGEGVIKNVWVKGTITSNYKFISALAGDTHGSIQNCVAEVTFNSGISGDGTHGGLVGRSMNGSNIVNCLIKTKMNAPSTSMSGGIAGWMNGKSSFENCLVINEWTLDESGCFTVGRNAAAQLGRAYNVFYVNKLGDTTGGTQITAADVKSGKACFLLNTDQSNIQWTQNLGRDEFPVPFKTHGQVYCSLNTKCDGTLAPQDKPGEVEEAYSNNQLDGVPTKHELHAGFCATCVGVNNKVDGITTSNASCKNTAYKGYWDPNFIERDTAGYYMVKTVDDMLWLAYTQPMYNEFAHIRLMNDLDYSAEGWWLNSANWFSGVIDGQGHKLAIAIPGNADNIAALVPELCGDIRDLWLVGSVSSARTFAGSFFGETQGDGTRGNGHATLTNCVSTVTINSTKTGDATTGGLGGCTRNECYLTNCIFAGKMEASGSEMNGGLIGWSDATTHLSNCIQIGTYNTGANGSNTVSRNPGKLAIDGPVYYLNALGDTPSGATKIGSSDDIASGALTYLANGDQSKIVWFQTLKQDAFPVPFSDHAQVYAQPSWGYGCDAQPLGDVTYTNEFQQIVIPDHQFANGFCSMCGKLESDYLRPNNDGFYELTTGRDLAWFSHKVSDEKNGALNALLTTDINMAEEDNALFAGIGNTGDAAFYGTFDGQGHTIDNLKISRDSYAGLICYAKGGATVKNLILGKDCKINASGGYTGIIGGTPSGASGTVTMDRLGFEGTAVAGGPNAAGIIGVNMGSSATFVITNCYVTGTVQGARESAAITGWTGGAKSTLANCWSSATVSGNDAGKDFFRNDETVPQNCYNKTDHNNTGKLKVYTDEQLKNGELACLLNQGDIQNPVWRQSIGYDDKPTFDTAHGIVNWIGATGYATQFIAESNVLIPEGVTAYTGFIDTPWIALRPVTSIIPAGTAVVLQGAQGYYSFIPVTVDATVENNDLKGTAEPLVATGSEYVLAQKDDAVGFFLAEAGTTIPAGKAYVEFAGAGVKGFVLEGTGINKVEATTDNETIFDLSGRRVEKAEKGIFIVNGKKVLK